jgi:hypothetical protein
MRFPSSCLAIDVSSDFANLAFGGHVTLCTGFHIVDVINKMFALYYHLDAIEY